MLARAALTGSLNNGNNFPTLSVQGSSSGVKTQTFNGLTLNAGENQIISRGFNANNTTIALGAITHNTGASLDFSNVGTGSTGVGLFTTTTGNTNGILGGWAVIDSSSPNQTGYSAPTDYAYNDGTGNITFLPAASYTVQAAGAITSAAAANYRVTATGGPALTTANAATTDINTLSLAPAATGNTTITVGTAGNGSTGILRVGANGGFLTGSGSGILTIGNTTNNGTLTAGGAANTAGEISFQINQRIDVNSVIANNGTGAVDVVVNAYSTPSSNTSLTLNGTNTYTGGTYINGGRVNAANSKPAFGTGPVYISANGQAILVANNAAYTNDFYLAGQSTNFSDTPSSLRLNGNTLTGKITLLSDAAVQTNGTNVFSGQITGNYAFNVGGTFQNGGGPGQLTLSNTSNNYAGNTVLNQGTLRLGASNVIPDGASAGNLVFTNANGGVLEMNGFSETVNGLTWAGTAGNVIIKNTSAGASVLSVGNNDQTSTFNGALQNSTGTLKVDKIGSGTLTLGDTLTTGNLNNYTGGTQIDGGVLKLVASAPSNILGSTAGALTVNSGGTLDLNGNSLTAGALAGTGGTIYSTATTASTLTVGDTTSTSFAGSIQNGAASAVNLVKQGTGTLDLTGTNSYTGTTTINAGTLQIGGTGSIPSLSSVSFGASSTAALQLGDSSGVVNLTLTAPLTNSSSTNNIEGGSSSNSTVTLNGAGTQTYANVFGGAGTNQNNLNLIVAGTSSPSSLLSGTSTYTGTTTINSGATLSLTGKLGATATTVNTGGTLSGFGNGTTTGVIGSSVTAQGGAAISLTNTAGSLTASSYTLGAASGGYANGATSTGYSTLTYTLGGSNAVESLNTAGVLTLNSGGAFISITNPNRPAPSPWPTTRA